MNWKDYSVWIFAGIGALLVMALIFGPPAFKCAYSDECFKPVRTR